MQQGQTICVPIKAIFPSTYFGLCHSRIVDLDFDVRGNLKRLFCKVLDVLNLATGGFQRINTSRIAKQGKTIIFNSVDKIDPSASDTGPNARLCLWLCPVPVTSVRCLALVE